MGLFEEVSMTIDPAFSGLARRWHSTFSAPELAALQRAIPQGIHDAQARTARANREYADPDDELYVYGIGMSRAVPKDIRAALLGEASYREEPIPRSSRKLMFIGKGLIFPIRVGDKMKRNVNQLRLPSLSVSRGDVFDEYGSRRPELADLELFEDPIGTDSGARVEDVVRHMGNSQDRSELFVAFYSSSPLGVGQIMWAPARLEGHYLKFLEPENLTFRKIPKTEAPASSQPRQVEGFADAPRPRTTVTRRTTNRIDKQDS